MLNLLNHPFYQAWNEGRLSKATLQDYAGQYFHHVEAFPTYLQNALEQPSDEPTRAILTENLAEEDGTEFGTPHPEMWLWFAEGLGVSRDTVKASKQRSGIRAVVDTFTVLSKSSISEALGALYAYESQVPEIARSKIEGLKKHFNIHDERTLAFFELHKIADVAHSESLARLIAGLPEAQVAKAQAAADHAGQALWDFLSEFPTENCA